MSVPGVTFATLVYVFHSGEDVHVVSFGVFGQACGPSINSGILSAVITVEDKPVMLQTTCAVHSGSSGGALFATNSGKLLGIQSTLLPSPFPPLLLSCAQSSVGLTVM